MYTGMQLYVDRGMQFAVYMIGQGAVHDPLQLDTLLAPQSTHKDLVYASKNTSKLSISLDVAWYLKLYPR